MTGSMLLYNEAGSSTTYRVRIALNLKKQEYELKTLDIDQQHHQSTEYLELKPQGLIPLLVHATNDGDVKLTQSVAIMEYLEDILPHQGTRLLPDSPVARARVRSLALHIACEMQPLNNTRVTKHIKKELQGDPETLRSWQIHWAETGFTGLEKELQSPETGSFCHGDQPTMADCCLVPQVLRAAEQLLHDGAAADVADLPCSLDTVSSPSASCAACSMLRDICACEHLPSSRERRSRYPLG